MKIRFLIKFLVTTFVCLMLLEWFCREFRPWYPSIEDSFDGFVVYNKDVGYKMANNFRGLYQQDYEMLYTTNSQGIRDREFSNYPEPDITRILAIGDSWTFGPGVELKDTWPKQLETLLNETGKKFEVINTGVSGYSTQNYLRTLKKFNNIYHPTTVIVMTTVNDPAGDLVGSSHKNSFLTSDDSMVKLFLKRHSHLAKQLWFLYQKSFSKTNPHVKVIELNQRLGETKNTAVQKAFKLYNNALIEMRDYCRENNIQLYLTVNLAGSAFEEKTKRLAKEEEITYISLSGTKGIKKLHGTNSAGHYNEQGYQKIAKTLNSFLLNENLDE